MSDTSRRAARARRWPWVVGLASAGAAAWAVYRASSLRSVGGDVPTDDAWKAHPGAVADMSALRPGAEPVRCRPWDFGRGVRGYVWHAPNPRAALLLQHGYGEYAFRYVESYNRLVPHLLDAGVSVYAFDLWGHGHSPGPRAVTDVRQAVDDHLAARRALRDQPLPVFLLGHSLGGLVTAGSVVRDPGGAAGVILSAAAFARPEDTAAVRFLAKVGAFLLPTLRAFPNSATPGLFRGAEHSPEVLDDPLFYRGAAPFLFAASGLSVLHENWAAYPGWRVPTLVLHGTADTFTDPDGSRRFAGAIASGDKTLRLVEGGYHELLNDTGRDETLRLILDWLEARLPARPSAEGDAGAMSEREIDATLDDSFPASDPPSWTLGSDHRDE